MEVGVGVAWIYGRWVIIWTCGKALENARRGGIGLPGYTDVDALRRNISTDIIARERQA